MVAPECPVCERVVPPEDINVAENVAYCRKCNEAHVLSELVEDAADEALLDEVNLNDPPPGVSYDDLGFDKTIILKHRSLAAAAGLTAMALFWNGIVSVFVIFNLLNTLQLLGIKVPWLQIEVGDEIGWGMTLFLWLFLTPFIVIGAAMVGGVLMALGGKTVIRIGKQDASYFTGVGFLGFRRRFDPQEIRKVKIVTSDTPRERGAGPLKQIVLEREGKPIKITAAGVNEDRRNYLAAALRHALPVK